MEVITKYPNEANALAKQGFKLTDGFANVQSMPDGTVKASFPMVKAVDGVVPTDDQGLVYDAGRVGAAKMYASTHEVDPATKSALEKAAAKSSITGHETTGHEDDHTAAIKAAGM